MAKLHRVSRSDDRLNSHVFTFIIPANIGQDNARGDVVSSEFMCGNQKWNISLVKQDKHIGSFLTLKNPSPGLLVTVDYGFTMLNRGHYTLSESFSEVAAIFSKQKTTQGRKAFIAIADLRNPAKGFLLEKDQLLLEVTLSNFKSTFEYQLQLPMTDKDRQRHPQQDVRLETGFFPFGGSEWNVTLKINERNPNDVRGGSAVMLRRLSNFDHYCKFRYRIHIGVIEPTPPTGKPVPPKAVHPAIQNKVISSNEMDSLFIDADTQDKLVLPTNIYKLATLKGVITIKIECIQATTLTLLQIPMDKNRHKALRCYDRDKQAWLFEAHLKSDRLKFYIFYGDIATVPRGCIRMMTIGVSVLPAYGGVKLVKALNSPYTRYFVQQHQDDFGLEVSTNIMMKDIIDTKSIYVYDTTNSLTVQIEWGDSYLLKETHYSTTDSIPRLHKMQMEKEIKMLQKENLILEKQVHSYQTAIAQKDSKGEYDPNVVPTRHAAQQSGLPPHAVPYNGLPGPNVVQDPYNMHGNQMMGGAAQFNSNAIASGQSNIGYNNIGPASNQYPGSRANDIGSTYNDSMGYGRNDMANQYGRNDLDTSARGDMYNAIDGRMPFGRADQYNSANGRYADPAISRIMGHENMQGGSFRDISMPVPAERGPRSRSADSSGVYISPMSDRRPNRRNSSSATEYADYLENNPHKYRHRKGDDRYKNNDGNRSDSGYKSDSMCKANDPRYNEHYSKNGRPRPSQRSKPSDSRSDYGDYHSEHRSKMSYQDRDYDAHSDQSAYTDKRGLMNNEQIFLKSNKPASRSSYAGHESPYPGLDYGGKSNYGRQMDRYGYNDSSGRQLPR